MASILDQLSTQGYAVVPQVLDADEVKHAQALFDRWWQANGPIPIPAHGVFKHHRAGHTAMAWFIRTRPSVQSVFGSIWGTDKLITSFDGFCYLPNVKRRNTNWLHVDQAPNDPVFRCVQGFVAVTDCESFRCVPGSHKLFESYMADHGLSHGKAWQKVQDIGNSVSVKVKSGDMVLWDSRTAHQNVYPKSGNRLVQYVCMVPRSRASDIQQAKRRHYFETRRTTSHWPTPIRVNALQPQIYGDASKAINYSKLVETDSELLETLAYDINKLV